MSSLDTKRLPGIVPGQRHPDWMILYEQAPEETLPWYIETLDPDFERQLKKEKSPKKSTLIDIGGGMGRQAAQMAALNFQVTATDVSPAAIAKALGRYPGVTFTVDDIRSTQIKESFDYVVDRGCFHVLDALEHGAYIESVKRLLKPKGFFLLKVFSSEMGTSSVGPLRFSMPALHYIFHEHFEILKIQRTQFYCSTGNHLSAWFMVMKGRSDV